MQRSPALSIFTPRYDRSPAVPVPDELFMREYPRLVHIAQRVLGDTAQAEDVAQDVFLAFAQRRGEVAEPAAWLYAAAVRRAINVRRGERRRRAREDRDLCMRLVHPSTTDGEPGAIVAAAETQRSIFDALAAIRPQYAAIVALRYAGCSYGEIAAALKLNPSSVGAMLARAMRALRKELLRESDLSR